MPTPKKPGSRHYLCSSAEEQQATDLCLREFESLQGYMNNQELVYEVAQVAAEHQMSEDINFTLGKDGEVVPWVDVSDLFWWGCADGEDITEENLPVLRQAIADLEAINSRRHLVGSHASVLFAARVRNLRPQGAYFKYLKVEDLVDNPEPTPGLPRVFVPNEEQTKALQDLFLALPERPIDLGNPKSTDGESYLYKRDESFLESETAK